MLRRGLRKATRDNPRADVDGFPALRLGGRRRVLCRLCAVALDVGGREIVPAILSAQRQCHYMLNLPRIAGLYAPAADVTDAIMTLEKRDAGLRGKRAAGRHG
jgi:hypothetical protein